MAQINRVSPGPLGRGGGGDVRVEMFSAVTTLLLLESLESSWLHRLSP